MTTKQLAKLKGLKAEIKMYEERITELKSLPKSFSAKNGYLAEKLYDTKDRISKDYAEIMNYIKNVDDPIVSMILKYKYINNFSWEKTAFKIGGGNKAASLRKRLYRYLKKRENTHSYLANKGEI